MLFIMVLGFYISVLSVEFEFILSIFSQNFKYNLSLLQENFSNFFALDDDEDFLKYKY